MMRSRASATGLLGGAAGLGAAFVNFIPPVPESLLIGSSIGLVTAALVGMASAALPVRAGPDGNNPRKEGASSPDRKGVDRMEIVKNFDELMERVAEVNDPEVSRAVSASLERSVTKVINRYPEWDREGRLMTYVLMKKISDSLEQPKSDSLDVAFQLLRTRRDEAAQLSHVTLNGNVEKMYRNPEVERARHLAGTLLLMNRKDEDYAKGMAIDAIHLWSDARFETLKEDFAMVSELSLEVKESVMDLVEREIAKAKRAGNVKASKRAKEIRMAIAGGPPRRSAG